MNKKIHCFAYDHSGNIGGEIQTLAAINVLDKIVIKSTGLIDRDNPHFIMAFSTVNHV